MILNKTNPVSSTIGDVGNKMNIRSFFQKKLKKMPRTTKLAIVPKGSSILEIQSLERALRSRPAQLALADLYQVSQSACSRNGKANMEVGSRRERNLVNALRLALGSTVRNDINNSAVEDMFIGDQPFSIKHVANKVGTPYKTKWTADAYKAREYIGGAGRKHPHLLVMYMDLKKEKVTAVCIESSRCVEVIRSLGEDAFDHKAGTNNRGIPHSKRAMQMLLEGCAFCVEMEEMKILGGLDWDQWEMDRIRHYFEKPVDKAGDEVAE